MRFFLFSMFLIIMTVLMPLQGRAQITTVAPGDESSEATVPTQQESLLRPRPWRSDDLLLQAERFIVQDQCTDAMGLLEKILKRNPRVVDAHVYRAHCHILLRNFDEAEDSLRMALRVDKRHLGAHYYLAKKNLMEGRVRRATDQLKAIQAICGAIPEECPEYREINKGILEFNTDKARADRQKLRNRDVSY